MKFNKEINKDLDNTLTIKVHHNIHKNMPDTSMRYLFDEFLLYFPDVELLF